MTVVVAAAAVFAATEPNVGWKIAEPNGLFETDEDDDGC